MLVTSFLRVCIMLQASEMKLNFVCVYSRLLPTVNGWRQNGESMLFIEVFVNNY